MKLIYKYFIFLFISLSSTSVFAVGDIIQQGEQIFLAKCDYCHGPGPQKSGTTLLQRRYKDALPALLSKRTNLTPEYIRTVVRTYTTSMTPYRITEINDQELDALAAYLTRNN